MEREKGIDVLVEWFLLHLLFVICHIEGGEKAEAALSDGMGSSSSSRSVRKDANRH